MSAREITLGEDLTVRRLGYGAMRITGPGIWGEPADPDECRAVLRRAVELGVDFIDTADSYGPEVSERLIGETLSPDRDDLTVATKAGLTRSGPDQWESDGRPEHIREACEGSLRRLGVERIDLYQFHRPDPDVPFEESVGTFAELQREGKVRHVGLSNVDAEELAIARSIVDIVSVQNRYSLTDRASEDVLVLCQREGIAFIPWFPLATGRLTRPGGELDQIAAAHEATQAQVAIAWLLQRSPVIVPIPGTSSVAHLEENMAAGLLELTDAEMATLENA
jgi:aryl-alcohol dehydrogenase-like predicted oxidoreductase